MNVQLTLVGVFVVIWFNVSNLDAQRKEPLADVEKHLELPSPELLVERYVLAIGGYELVESTTSFDSQMSVTSLNNDGITFEYQGVRSGDLYFQEYLGSDGRTTRRGIRNGVGYEMLNGALREMGTKEISTTLRMIRSRSEASSWIKQSKEAVCVGVETVRGRDAYRLKLVFKDGLESIKYFDAGSGLLVRSIEKSFPNGTLQTSTFDFLEYMKVGDQLLPKKHIANYGGKLYEFVLDSCKFEVDSSDERLQFPSSFNEFLDRKK